MEPKPEELLPVLSDVIKPLDFLPAEIFLQVGEHLVLSDINSFRQTSWFLFKLLQSTFYKTASVHRFKNGKIGLEWIVSNGREDILRQILKINPDISSIRNDSGQTLLHIAIDAGDVGQLKLLLDAGGIDLSIKSCHGGTALESALGKGLDYIKPLVDYGADLELKNYFGQTALCAIAETYRLDSEIVAIVDFLISRGASTHVDQRISLPLHMACKFGSVYEVRNCLRGGCDPNDRDSFKRTPLHDAAKFGRNEIIGILLEAGADPNAESKNGATPLHCVSDNIDGSNIRMLVHAAGDPNMVYEDGGTPLIDGGTPLIRALLKGVSSRVICALLEFGADVNVVDRSFSTPLICAMLRHATSDVIYALLEAGADVNVRGDCLWTPLHIAIFVVYPNDTICALLEAGADVNSADENLWTPLHSVVFSRKSDNTIFTLLEAGADVNVADENLWTPLHNAAHGLSERSIRILLHAGAKINARDKKGFTPLDVANKALALANSDEKEKTRPQVNESILNSMRKTIQFLVAAGATCSAVEMPTHWYDGY